MPTVATLGVMEVLGAPSRCEIVDLLRDGALPVNALVARLDLTQPAVSKHLRVLREAGLVRVQADGRRRLYALRPEPLMELAEWLEPYREMWRESLDRLEHGEATMEGQPRFDHYVERFEAVLGRQEGPPTGVHRT